MAIGGYATEAGTDRYRRRHAACHPDHFRRLADLWVSSIGLGTYLGDPDDATDQAYAQAIETALARGCNVLDTAINYRCQRSERTIGRTLARMFDRGAIARDEVFLCTKGGYLPFDGAVPDDPGRYFAETFLNTGRVHYDELVAGCHCLSPSYLEQQLSDSLRNLGVSTLDVYYLHNPEQQLDAVPRDAVLARLDAAFRLLERKVQEGSLRWYGTATWNGYRANSRDAGFLKLQDLVEIAGRVGGASHHFRVIQLPYNLSMPEAFAFKNQPVNGEVLSTLEVAQRLGVSAIISASLLQSRLTRLPEALRTLLPGLDTDAQRAIQFVRSTPGVTSALVGMKQTAHVEANLELATRPALAAGDVGRLFTPHQFSRADG